MRPMEIINEFFGIYYSLEVYYMFVRDKEIARESLTVMPRNMWHEKYDVLYIAAGTRREAKRIMKRLHKSHGYYMIKKYRNGKEVRCTAAKQIENNN